MAHTHVPTVEMLWEARDPDEVLEERFGFRDPASAGRWVAETVHEHWGVRVGSCDRIVMSDHNAMAWLSTPSGRLLAKWSVARARFAGLAQVARLTAWLDRNGLPVSAPLPATDGRLQVELDDASIGLQRVINGDLLDVENVDQVRAAGATLARLHRALAACPGTDRLVPAVERPEPLPARITGWLGTAGEHVPEVARTALRRLVSNAPVDLPPAQLLHGDFRSANILCAGPTIVAVIDFEEARVDHCIDEVARSAVMLGTRFRDWGPVSAEVRTTFREGYESVRQLTTAERRWWDVLVLGYTLAFVPPGDDPTGWEPSALSHLAAVTRG